MKITIKPSSLKGGIYIPTSKSYAHRYIISSLLTSNDVTIKNINLCEDVICTLEAVKAFNKTYKILGNDVIITKSNSSTTIIDCKESASTLRFMIPLALVLNKKITFTGNESLFKRGLEPYLEIFKSNNVNYELTNTSITIDGKLNGASFDLTNITSSQYLTGMLNSLPLLNNDSIIKYNNESGSIGYLDVTLDVLKQAGINIIRTDNELIIKGNQTYHQKDVEVLADATLTAYLKSFNLFGNKVLILNENVNSIEPDNKFGKIVEAILNNKITNKVINVDNVIDLAPLLFVLAGIFNTTTFTNIQRLKLKESNRIEEMMKVMDAYHINYILNDNEITIYQSNITPPNNELILNDHRIIMAACMLAVRYGGTLDGCEHVKKSYPNYFKDLIKLGVKLEER